MKLSDRLADRLEDFAFWGSWYWFLTGILFTMILSDLTTNLNFGWWLLVAPISALIQFVGCLIVSAFLRTFGSDNNNNFDDYDDVEY